MATLEGNLEVLGGMTTEIKSLQQRLNALKEERTALAKEIHEMTGSKDAYEAKVDGNKFKVSTKIYYVVPKDITHKAKVFYYLLDKYGDVMAWESIGFNANTFQSLAKSELEAVENAAEGAPDASLLNKFYEIFGKPVNNTRYSY